MAADKGDTLGMTGYALIVSSGDKFAKNSAEAAKYYKMAADKGEPFGMIGYASMFSRGEWIPKNSVEAAKYYKMAADKGNYFSYKKWIRYDDKKNCL